MADFDAAGVGLLAMMLVMTILKCEMIQWYSYQDRVGQGRKRVHLGGQLGTR